ncbi:MAG: signal peptidase I [Levilactobacillus sp.]|jgi:signal peptidase I|uniref:Signal peptidase I n=1 Tax=Levilactobacillus suantsaiihabitans TaxID=2487722 RepID=A0A4Z0JAJ9_9LACO|nr:MULTISPECIES: signal peptidase I [Levilactobacillus]MCI1554417.1 signal peptidase I [Levilactobacillus sp.]MCI1598252.1 signal peptidase I [Levilactobacillus sp.]MCI1605899.1 signal peptidase I [Levilactobacillus sp.]TGD19114.1 signal peptidase I [Levilactobacillus suantsaiihabitans]
MKALKEVMSWIIPVIIGLAIAFAIKSFVFTRVRVDGPSMEPNLQNNEKVFAWKQAKVKHLSVIVFDAHGEDPSAKVNTNYVKRVIGLPGDTVTSKNGYIYVNHKKINQSFISKSERTSGTGNWTLASLQKTQKWNDGKAITKVVPKGKYFVLGDHRSVSNDSRYWGFVDKDKVLGVVKVPFWASNKTRRANVNSLAY